MSRVKKRRWVVVLVVVLVVLVVGGGAAAYALDRVRSDELAQGVRIAGIDVGGMTTDEARAVLKRRILPPAGRPVVVVDRTRGLPPRPRPGAREPPSPPALGADRGHADPRRPPGGLDVAARVEVPGVHLDRPQPLHAAAVPPPELLQGVPDRGGTARAGDACGPVRDQRQADQPVLARTELAVGGRARGPGHPAWPRRSDQVAVAR